MSEPRKPKTRYRSTNWTAYNAAFQGLTIWLDKNMQRYHFLVETPLFTKCKTLFF